MQARGAAPESPRHRLEPARGALMAARSTGTLIAAAGSMIAVQSYGSSSFLGEVWYAEADTPLGPWVYARKVVTHHRYSFYNPKRHPMFDQDGGRVIYFEGTYAATFSGNPDPTPRYDYNQVMYQLDLSDPRLALPVAIYEVPRTAAALRLAWLPGLHSPRESEPCRTASSSSRPTARGSPRSRCTNRTRPARVRPCGSAALRKTGPIRRPLGPSSSFSLATSRTTPRRPFLSMSIKPRTAPDDSIPLCRRRRNHGRAGRRSSWGGSGETQRPPGSGE